MYPLQRRRNKRLDDEHFGPDTKRDVKVTAKYHIWKKVKFIDGPKLHRLVMREVVKVMSVPDEFTKNSRGNTGRMFTKPSVSNDPVLPLR